MSTSFTKKKLVAVLSLVGKSTFGEGANTKVVEGLRMQASIRKEGFPAKGTMDLSIYGMPENDMNALTTLAFRPMRVYYHQVKLLAGDDSGLATAFQGEIITAAAAYNSAPNLPFRITAAEGFYTAIATSRPRSFKGGASVASVMEQLAKDMGYAFENHGVKGVVANPYLVGSAYTQAAQLATAANIEFGIDDGVLFIAPRNGPRAGEVPLVSAATGLKGYPTFDKSGIHFECLYNPALRLNGLVRLESAVKPANGTWRIFSLGHNLSSEDPGGQWVSQVHVTPLGLP